MFIATGYLGHRCRLPCIGSALHCYRTLMQHEFGNTDAVTHAVCAHARLRADVMNSWKLYYFVVCVGC